MFFKKVNKPWIKFHTESKILGALPPPVPARKAMPDWFKKLKPKIDGETAEAAGSIKKCIPVLDAVSLGYIIPLWADIIITVEEGFFPKLSDGTLMTDGIFNKDALLTRGNVPYKDTGLNVVSLEPSNELLITCKMAELEITSAWGEGKQELIGSHDWKQVGEACDLKKFKLGRVLMKFNNPWIIETPKGYSVQFKNPANNWSNDIQLIEGVVDTDEFYSQVNFPFVWTGSEIGEFIIPQGTPLVHIIPFKRETYEMETGEIDIQRRDTINTKILIRFNARYKNLFWHKRKDKTV